MGWKTLPGAGGADADAIHDNVAAEISAIAAKGVPVDADFLVIEDSAAADAKKRITLGTLPSHAPAAHTAASHSDQGATGAELETLTDGSDADALHTHSADGIDTSAIHDDVAGEIAAIADKAAPVGADVLLIEDSAAANAKKKVTITNLPGGADADAIHDNVAGEIDAIAEETPVAGDWLVFEDTSDGDNKKKADAGDFLGGFTFSGVSVHRNGTDQAIGAAAGQVAILWTTEDFDTDAYHDTGANTSRLVAPTTAKYLVTGIVACEDLDDNDDLIIRIRQDGSTEIARVWRRQVNTSDFLIVSFGYVLALTAADYIEITVNQGGGGAFTVDGDRVDTCIQMTRLA